MTLFYVRSGFRTNVEDLQADNLGDIEYWIKDNQTQCQSYPIPSGYINGTVYFYQLKIKDSELALDFSLRFSDRVWVKSNLSS